MDSPTGDLCCQFSLQRPLLDFEGACLCVWPRCHSGALMYGCSLCLSLSLSLSNRVCILSLCLSCFFSVLSCLSLSFSVWSVSASSVLDSRCVLLVISTGASLS